MAITVALLAYKEADNLRWLIPKIKEQVETLGEEYNFMVIDSMEPLDDTEEVCDKYGVVYINQEEPYFGGAMRTAFKYVNNDKLLMLDADGSHDPKYIPQMYEALMSGADLVIGSRYVPGGSTVDSKSSQVMSKILNTTFRMFLGIDAHDFSAGYRMYHTEDVKKLKLHCNNFDTMEEIAMKMKLNKPGRKLVVKEVPIHFVKREYGQSKRSLIKFILSFIDTLYKLVALRFVAGKKYDPDKDDEKADNVAFGMKIFTAVVAASIFLKVVKKILK
ncbi:glycosyltransferase [Eubacterium sp.]|uniref:glycosyltransferase n=1 Tax=Eubacterium sp. TaxID=142586 RepID=UPI0025CBEFA5|nr:glycosyltransferase [Eubacterium sp.]MCR5630091.1 glycosyltransferase [Eubacterium sp.]